MPAATRVSTFTSGQVSGSTYVYFCSAGTTATIVSDLEFGMQSDGYAITEIAAGDFIATKGSHPTHRIEVNAQHPLQLLPAYLRSGVRRLPLRA